MLVFHTIDELKDQLSIWHRAAFHIGLVPTMGYLHEGHASLVKAALKKNDRVVVSIFVNPTQFGPNEDLESYPRDFEADCKLLEELGVHMVFAPTPKEMYGDDFSTWIEMTHLNEGLCGKTRPIHFRGVCTVVGKLFNLVKPKRAYFGQKDAQQLAIIRRMVRDLNFEVEIVGCPIVREADGLAKSSRNTYLNAEERTAALCLSQAVFLGQKMVDDGVTDTKTIVDAMKKHISGEKLAKIDYVEAVDGVSMQPVDTIKRGTLFAMAVYIGKTRLIDNFSTK